MTRQALAAFMLVVSLPVTQVSAQELRQPAATSLAPAPAGAPARTGATWLQPAQFDLQPQPKRSPFGTVAHDFRVAFGTRANLRLLGGIGLLALTSAPFDSASADEAREHLAPGRFSLGNTGGGLLVQSGLAAGTWAAGKLLHAPRATAVGADLIEAQLVTQTVVQGLKYSVRRPRPDGSNNLSFPSGHTASSFATATVLTRHFGWAMGVPAYAFATYVGAARMSANKHHLSDVIMGAGIGLVAGRAVTVGVAGQRFDLGVAPASRGAMVTFTRK